MAEQPQLILHVGHSKTGSSALQSLLALNTARLAEMGYAYPEHPSFSEARRGNVSSGNLIPARLEDWYDAACRDNPTARRILFSTELAFFHYLKDPALIAALCARGVEVRIIVFIRDPVEHAVSSYVQQVKRGGLDGDLDEYLNKYAMPIQVERFFKAVPPTGARIQVFNYSRHRAHLSQTFVTALGLDTTDLEPLPFAQVNRSLTQSEIYLQRRFNALWGQGSSAFVADALCNDAPGIDVALPVPSKAAHDAFVRKFAPVIERLQAHLPEAEAYRITGFESLRAASPGQADGRLVFQPEQIDALVAALSRHIPQPQIAENMRQLSLAAAPGYTLSAADVQVLLDTASALAPGNALLQRRKAALASPRRSLLRRVLARVRRGRG